MAAELTVPTSTRTNRPLSIAGTEFEADTEVVISVVPADITFKVTSDVSGDFDAASVGSWTPSKPGRYTVRAMDGTNDLSADVLVSSTT